MWSYQIIVAFGLFAAVLTILLTFEMDVTREDGTIFSWLVRVIIGMGIMERVSCEFINDHEPD